MANLSYPHSTSIPPGISTIRLILIVGIVILALILIGEVIYYLFVAPQQRITNILVEGDVEISRDDLLQTAGLDRLLYYRSVDMDNVRQRLLTHPLLADVAIDKEYPDTLRLTLSGKVPLVIGLASSEQGTLPMAFDRQGVVFRVGGQIDNWDLPVLSGLKFQEIYPGVQLPAEVNDILADLNHLRVNAPSIYQHISELRLLGQDQYRDEALLYLKDYRTSVRVGRSLDEQTMNDIMTVLRALRSNGTLANIKEIDFRTGQAVYHLRSIDNG